MVNLTEDQAKLLYLLSLYTRPAGSRAESEVWIKTTALQALILHLIDRGVFTGYDYAPQTSSYLGLRRYVNVSQEGMDDLADLREAKLVQRLKLSTDRYAYISAYRITSQGLEAVKGVSGEVRSSLEHGVRCERCGDLFRVELESDGPVLVCDKDKVRKHVKLLEIEDVPYACKPAFMGGEK